MNTMVHKSPAIKSLVFNTEIDDSCPSTFTSLSKR